ncbi:MAG: CoA transferase [Chloroflexi bacterium]|nr:CoA transferase [Chloroflexota bacterium]
MPSALSGLKIIEFGSFISAPFCAKLMADLGAEVIKTEEPKVGDDSRRFGPFPGDIPHLEKSGLFLYMNANKRGITVNPRTATGLDIIKALIADADVLIENQQPGVMRELGLDYERLERINPRLVMTSISTFGQTGPYKDYKGYDMTAWHGSGVGPRFAGREKEEPLRGAWYHADHWGAISAATATMLALAARDLTGEGQLVDLSQVECLATHILGYQLVTLYHLTGETSSRAGDILRGGAPAGLFKTKDGFMCLLVMEDQQWVGIKRAMGNPQWTEDPVFNVPSWQRAEVADMMYELMDPWWKSHTNDELFQMLQAERVPAGPLYTPKDLLHHPHLEARGFFQEVAHPKAGTVRMPGAPYRFSETPWRIQRPAPMLGAHNKEILSGLLGFSGVDLTDMRRTGII